MLASTLMLYSAITWIVSLVCLLINVVLIAWAEAYDNAIIILLFILQVIGGIVLSLSGIAFVVSFAIWCFHHLT